MNQAWTRFLPAFLRAKIEGRAYLQNVVSNTGWQFADNIVRMGIGLFVGVWIARYLGPEQFGIFSYALALVALFAAFASLGLEDIVVRDVVRDPECKDETLGTAFFLKLSGAAIAFIAAMACILVLHPDDGLYHWLVGVISLGTIFQALNVIEFWFHSQVRAKYVVFAKNGAFLVSSALKIALILSEAPLVAFAWVGTFEIAAGSAGLVIAYWSRGQLIRNWQASLGRAKGLLRDSWPLLFTGMVIMLYMRIDQVMLGEMAGSEEVGVYSVAVRLAELWMFIPMAIFWSVFPAIVEARDADEKLFYDRLQKLYNLLALAAYAVALPVTLLSEWLVGTLFGDAYSDAGFMLKLLVWSNLFTFLEIGRSSFLSSMNWTRIHFFTVSLGCILNIWLNYLLIPPYGGVGAVTASLVSYWFAAHGSCFLLKPLFRTGTMMTRAILFPKIW
jgi:O-antigen/teichoic acid export membrane protein